MKDVLTAGHFSDYARYDRDNYLRHGEFAGKWEQSGAGKRLTSIMDADDSNRLGRVASKDGGSYQLRTRRSTTKGAVMAFVNDCEDFFSSHGYDPAKIKDRVMTNLFGNDYETNAKLDFKSINVGKCKEIVRQLVADMVAAGVKDLYEEQYLTDNPLYMGQPHCYYQPHGDYMMHEQFAKDASRGIKNIGTFNVTNYIKAEKNKIPVGSMTPEEAFAARKKVEADFEEYAIELLQKFFKDNNINKDFMPFVSIMLNQTGLGPGAASIGFKIAFPDSERSKGTANVSKALLPDHLVNAYYLQYTGKLKTETENRITGYQIMMGEDNKIHIINTDGCRFDLMPDEEPLDAKDLEARKEARKYAGKTVRATVEFVIDPNQKLTVNKDGKVECPQFEAFYRSEVFVTPKNDDAPRVQ